MIINLIKVDEIEATRALVESILEKIDRLLNVSYWRLIFGKVIYFADVLDFANGVPKLSHSYAITSGIGLFVYHEGGTGFSSTNIISEDTINRIIKMALKSAKISANIRKLRLDLPEELGKFGNSIPPKVLYPPTDERFTDLLNQIKDEAFYLADKNSLKLKNIIASIGFYLYHRSIYDSLGNELGYTYPIYGADISVTSKSQGNVFEGYESVFAIGGLELLKRNETSPNYLLKGAFKNMLNKIRGKKIKPTKTDIVAGPDLSGTVAHESFGHLSEADSVIDGSSYLSDKVGKMLGPEILNIVDTGRFIQGGIWLPFDDEGVATRDIYLVEKGIFKGYLHSIITASLMNKKSTGNGRASSPMVYPIVRMRNTYILPGDATKEELFEELKRGIFIESVDGGETKDSGTFIFTAKNAYYIENGEIKFPIKNITIRGHIADFLSNIKMLSKEFKIQIGFCEKNDQTILVGLGGPYVLVKDAIIGGS